MPHLTGRRSGRRTSRPSRASLRFDVEIDDGGEDIARSALPKELLLHTDSDFVASCARRMRKSYLTYATVLRKGIQGAISEPNWVLTIWAAACFKEHAEFAEEWQVAPQFTAALEAANAKAWWGRIKPPSPDSRVSVWQFLKVPLAQFFLLFIILMAQLVPADGTQPEWCIQEPEWKESKLGLQVVWFVVDIMTDAALYLFAILQTRWSFNEWHAISFLTSLHWRPRENLIAYAAYLIELLNNILYSINLYMIIIQADDVISVVFNATALTFLLEMDNVIVSITQQRKAAHAADTLTRIGGENATFNDLVLYMTAPANRWCMFGFHQLQSAWLRDALRIGSKILFFVLIAIHVAMYTLILQCHVGRSSSWWANGTSNATTGTG
jgi:hypothetical protein